MITIAILLACAAAAWFGYRRMDRFLDEAFRMEKDRDE